MKTSKIMERFAGEIRGEVRDWIRNQLNDPDTQIVVRPFGVFAIVTMQYGNRRAEYAVEHYMPKEPRLLLLLENYKKNAWNERQITY